VGFSPYGERCSCAATSRKIQVIWDLSVDEIDAATCRYTNRIVSYPTQSFLDILAAAGQTFPDTAVDR
jgi:hypothetical protein